MHLPPRPRDESASEVSACIGLRSLGAACVKTPCALNELNRQSAPNEAAGSLLQLHSRVVVCERPWPRQRLLPGGLAPTYLWLCEQVTWCTERAAEALNGLPGLSGQGTSCISVAVAPPAGELFLFSGARRRQRRDACLPPLCRCFCWSGCCFWPSRLSRGCFVCGCTPG